MEITYRSMRVATVDFGNDPSTTPVAHKGFDVITLGVPLQLQLDACKDNRWVIPSFNADLLSQEPGSPKLLGSGLYVGNVMPAKSGFRVPVVINVRCSPRALAEYEDARDGSSVKLRCELRGTIYGLVQSNGREHMSDPSPVYVSIDFELPQHIWASMLRPCGLSASVFLEIPLPPSNADRLNDGHRALLSALEAFEHGGTTAWKDSVGHIRPYLEDWIKRKPLPSPPPTDGSYADREWKLLNLRNALHKCCHVIVHKNKGACTRKDALLILNTFACLLEVQP